MAIIEVEELNKDNKYLILGALLGLAITLLYDVLIDFLKSILWHQYPLSSIFKITASVAILIFSFYWYRQIK